MFQILQRNTEYIFCLCLFFLSKLHCFVRMVLRILLECQVVSDHGVPLHQLFLVYDLIYVFDVFDVH